MLSQLNKGSLKKIVTATISRNNAQHSQPSMAYSPLKAEFTLSSTQSNPFSPLGSRRWIHTPSKWQELQLHQPYPKEFISMGGVSELMLAVWADMNSSLIFEGSGASQPKHTVYTGAYWISDASDTFRNTIPAGQLWSEFSPIFKQVVKRVLPEHEKYLVKGDYLALDFYTKIREGCIEYARKSTTLTISRANVDSINVSQKGQVSVNVTFTNGKKEAHKLANTLPDVHVINNAKAPNIVDAHARLSPAAKSMLKKSPHAVKALKEHGGNVNLETGRISIKTKSVMEQTKLSFPEFFENLDPIVTAIYMLGTSLSSTWLATIREMHASIPFLPDLKPGGECNNVIFGTNNRQVNFKSQYPELNDFNKHAFAKPDTQKVTMNTGGTNEGMLLNNFQLIGNKIYYDFQVTTLDGLKYDVVISETGFISATGSKPFELPIKGVNAERKLSLVTTCHPTALDKSNKNHPRNSLPFNLEYAARMFGLDKAKYNRSSMFPLICDGQKQLAELAQRVHEDFDLSQQNIYSIVRSYIQYRLSTHTVPTAREAIEHFSQLICKAYLKQYGPKGFNEETIKNRVLKSLSSDEIEHLFSSKNKTNAAKFDEAYLALHEAYKERSGSTPKP